ncbi:MAG TPA: serine/threonine-protein kinase [Pyrinomonadaceae bacterium]
MSPNKWQRILDLFEEALERPVGERAAFLDHACAGDISGRQRLEAMLAADGRNSLLLDRPIVPAASAFPSANSFIETQGLSGALIGPYQLIKELGRGGMGKVYRAYDTRLGRIAALKVLPSKHSSQERVMRFQREARTASSLNHPNIITIYDFGVANGRDYIVSEFVDGRTLRSFINDPDLTLNKILDLVIQVASALEAAHAAGIVHRDIKPENIMVRPDGYVKVLDFGLAKLTEQEESGEQSVRRLAGADACGPNCNPVNSNFETRTGTLVGTFKYMSPEQARGHKVDPRSDLFSLGIILYELVTGQRPFKGETWHHTMVAITDVEPRPIAAEVSGAPNELQRIISTALAKKREHRYQTARDLLNDLEALKEKLSDETRVERAAGGALTRRGGTPWPPYTRTNFSQLSTVAVGKENLSLKSEGDRKKERASTEGRPYKWYQFAVGLLIVVVATLASYHYGRSTRVGPLRFTDKDTILLADFVNETGEPVFDNTLKQGLAVQLAQSPYLNLFPEERARETLGLMERSRDEKITRGVAREICQRRGIKALLVGSISSLGHNYVITLEAVNSQSGETIAYQQTEAEGKEQVLKALGKASTAMREELGESLASISKFDAPIEQATTSSLEALKDFAAGVELRRKGLYAQSVPLFQRAIEQDKDFALAYLNLGNSYRDMRSLALGNDYLKKAYELRERVSERERLEISATYFRYITGELDKRTETTALLTTTYPQSPDSFHFHGNSLMIGGEFEQAAAAYRSALDLDPEYSLSRTNLALALMGLNKFDEAREVINQGLARGLDTSGFHNRLYLIAVMQGDYEEAQRQVNWFVGKPDEYQMREIQARTFAFGGRRRQAAEAFEQAATMAQQRGLPAERIRILVNEANMNALFGQIQLAQKQMVTVLKLLETESVAPEELQPSLIQQLDSPGVGWTLALCHDFPKAEILIDAIAGRVPLDTLQQTVWIPVVRATLESNPEKSIQLLQGARQYEAATFFKPEWVRAQSYLEAKDGAHAATEFQRIVDHRGWDLLSPLWPLAQLGRARSFALQGDIARSRQAYESFFQLWKSADGDVPLLLEAKREYVKLHVQ